MKKISITALILMVLTSFAPSAEALSNPILPSNTPNINNVTSTSATFSVSPEMANTISAEDQARLYFEYYETRQVCIMIYPTPENCLPKKTPQGAFTTTVYNLKPNTSYTVQYKIDNIIACIQAPCPGNGLESGQVEFMTTPSGVQISSFARNLRVGSRGVDVTALQDVLRAKGYLNVQSTGYFGTLTFRAVRMFQSNERIISTGFVGPLTRNRLNTNYIISTPPINYTEERFEGTIQAVSTGCYSDGECSVTIDGKKVVTTIGWSQNVVGSIKGTVNNIGDIETSKIGARASVYAKKTTDGYTLYGNANYYIEVK